MVKFPAPWHAAHRLPHQPHRLRGAASAGGRRGRTGRDRPHRRQEEEVALPEIHQPRPAGLRDPVAEAHGHARRHRHGADGGQQVRDGGPPQLDGCLLQDLCLLAARSLALHAEEGRGLHPVDHRHGRGEGRPQGVPVSGRWRHRDQRQARGRIPAIGVGVPMAEAKACAGPVPNSSLPLDPSHLVCQIDGRKDGQARSRSGLRRVEMPAPESRSRWRSCCPPRSRRQGSRRHCRAVRAGGLKPDAIVVTQMHDLKSFQPNTPRPWGPTYEEMAAAVRKHFPGVTLGGGMLSYLHRAEPQARAARACSTSSPTPSAPSCMPPTTSR